MTTIATTFKRTGHKAAGVLVIRGDGKILAISRADGRGLGLPFGKAEPGEDALTTARRELLEETGLYAGRLTHLYERNGNVAYVTRSWIGELRGRRAEGEPLWVEPATLIGPENEFADFNHAVLRRAGILE